MNSSRETKRCLILLIAAFCAGCGSEDSKITNNDPSACDSLASLKELTEFALVDEFVVGDKNIYSTNYGSYQSSGYNNDGRVMKTPLNGGETVNLAEGEMFPSYIVVDDTNVYWATKTEIRKMPLGGDKPVTLASSSGVPQSLILSGGYVYWTTSMAKLMRAAIDGSKVEELVDGSASNIAFTGLAMDETYLYWGSRGLVGTNTDSIFKMPIAGGPVTTLATGQVQPAHVAVNATHVYWTNVGDFHDEVGLIRAPLEGGIAETVVSSRSAAYAKYAEMGGIFVNANDVYYTVKGTKEYDYYDGSVVHLPLDGGAPETLASGLRYVGEGITKRDCDVYFEANGHLEAVGAP